MDPRLSEPLQRLIEAERGVMKAPNRAAAHDCWSGIVGKLEAGVPPPSLESLPSLQGASISGLATKHVLLALAILGGGAGASVLVHHHLAPSENPSLSPPIVEVSQAVKQPEAMEPAPTPAPLPGTLVPDLRPDPPTAVPWPETHAPPSRTNRRRTPTRADLTSACSGEVGLEAELVWIGDARRALAERLYPRVLTSTAQHAACFPKGDLAEEREALRAIALCTSGQRRAGQRVRDVFFRTYRGSPLTDRVRKACQPPSGD